MTQKHPDKRLEYIKKKRDAAKDAWVNGNSLVAGLYFSKEKWAVFYKEYKDKNGNYTEPEFWKDFVSVMAGALVMWAIVMIG